VIQLKWRFCPCCHKWRQSEDWTCTACGNPLQAGRITREEKADPRVQQPVGNREQKPL
jgi:uncharacterized paraquat-inducible protein A